VHRPPAVQARPVTTLVLARHERNLRTIYRYTNIYIESTYGTMHHSSLCRHYI
jgi:hypothetical protein